VLLLLRPLLRLLSLLLLCLLLLEILHLCLPLLLLLLHTLATAVALRRRWTSRTIAFATCPLRSGGWRSGSSTLPATPGW
jgi:hypothetical protein